MTAQRSDPGSAPSVGLPTTASPPNTASRTGLTAAIKAMERLPVLTDSRDRVQEAANGVVRVGAIIGAVESDVGLMVATLRLANGSQRYASQRVATVPEAIEVIGPLGVEALARAAPAFDLLGSSGGSSRFEEFRLHALSVQRTADQIAKLTGQAEREELAVTSLLHDIGHLVISELHPDRKPGEDAVSRSPEERLQDEREALRIDHTRVGGVLARRWRLPLHISAAIERHHADDASGLAAHVALADMIVHYGKGNAFSDDRIEAARRVCGLSKQGLRVVA